jgi:ribosomal protein S18 acetylase RimI-like enzyme
MSGLQGDPSPRPSPRGGGARVMVRDFAPHDAEACARIFDRGWHAGHPYAPRAIDGVAFMMETKDERLLVAESGGAVVGFVSLYEPQSFIHHLYVDPTQARRGVGSALLGAALDRAGGRASLRCQTRNEGALAFYRRHGFVEVAAGIGEFGTWIALSSP